MTTCIMPSRDDREWIVRGGGNGMPLILKRRLRHHPCAGVLAPGHPSDRRRGTLGKISRKGGRRTSRVTRSAHLAILRSGFGATKESKVAAGDIVPVPGAQFEETLASASPDVLRAM